MSGPVQGKLINLPMCRGPFVYTNPASLIVPRINPSCRYKGSWQCDTHTHCTVQHTLAACKWGQQAPPSGPRCVEAVHAHAPPLMPHNRHTQPRCTRTLPPPSLAHIQLWLLSNCSQKASNMQPTRSGNIPAIPCACPLLLNHAVDSLSSWQPCNENFRQLCHCVANALTPICIWYQSGTLIVQPRARSYAQQATCQPSTHP
jgi:hypothetical protein